MTNKEKLLELKQCQNNECVCRKGFGLCPQCHGVLDELIASYRIASSICSANGQRTKQYFVGMF